MKAILECHACSYVEGLARQEQVRAALVPDTLHGLAFAHPPTFTFGRHAKPDHLLVPDTFLRERGVALVKTERGGEITFHGPGQLVFYPVFHLGNLGVRRWVRLLEEAMLIVLAGYGAASYRENAPGTFLGGKKIGFVGLRIREGVSTHGVALNLSGDLAPFAWMNPCGIAAMPVTSLERESGRVVDWREVARAYMDTLAGLLIGERP